MLAQIKEWQQTESDCRADQLAEERTRLGKAETRLSRLLDVYIDGSIEQADYARKKEEQLHEKAGVRERIRRIEREGSAWLEPMECFLNAAILAETTAFSGTEAELRDFHRRIGSNLSLIEPKRPESAAGRRARASKERAAKFTKPKAWSSSRRGGFAARDSIQDETGRQAGPEIAYLAVTSEDHPTSDAGSHDSASPGRKSSSRWADRAVPVLQVEFPEPWSIIAAAHVADATGAKCAGNLKWSGRLDLNQRPLHPQCSALPDCATARTRSCQGCGPTGEGQERSVRIRFPRIQRVEPVVRGNAIPRIWTTARNSKGSVSIIRSGNGLIPSGSGLRGSVSADVARGQRLRPAFGPRVDRQAVEVGLRKDPPVGGLPGPDVDLGDTRGIGDDGGTDLHVWDRVDPMG